MTIVTTKIIPETSQLGFATNVRPTGISTTVPYTELAARTSK
jgi:hypothetical protein